jgi:hypothetical protein
MAALIPSASATGSGTMTLAGPSTNSNQTVTIPDTTGTMMVSGNMPAFSAYNSSSTTLSAGTYTKIALQTETFDTNSYFDNATNYRFTPLISGYYQINGGVSTNNPAGAVTCAIYKNGSVYQKGGIIVPQPGTTLAGSVVAGIVYFNGSTDYVELYAIQTNGSSQTTNANSYDTYFNGSMVRGA